MLLCSLTPPGGIPSPTSSPSSVCVPTRPIITAKSKRHSSGSSVVAAPTSASSLSRLDPDPNREDGKAITAPKERSRSAVSTITAASHSVQSPDLSSPRPLKRRASRKRSCRTTGQPTSCVYLEVPASTEAVTTSLGAEPSLSQPSPDGTDIENLFPQPDESCGPRQTNEVDDSCNEGFSSHRAGVLLDVPASTPPDAFCIATPRCRHGVASKNHFSNSSTFSTPRLNVWKEEPAKGLPPSIPQESHTHRTVALRTPQPKSVPLPALQRSKQSLDFDHALSPCLQIPKDCKTDLFSEEETAIRSILFGGAPHKCAKPRQDMFPSSVSRIVILVQSIILLFMLYGHSKMRSEMADIRSTLYKLEGLLLFVSASSTPNEHVTSLREALLAVPRVTNPAAPTTATLNHLQETTSEEAISWERASITTRTFHLCRHSIQRAITGAAPLRIKPRKRSLFRTNSQYYGFYLLYACWTSVCYLCKTLFGWLLGTLIRMVVLAIAVPALLLAAFKFMMRSSSTFRQIVSSRIVSSSSEVMRFLYGRAANPGVSFY